MLLRKRTPTEKLADLMGWLEESHRRWEEICSNGCADPFWPDGMNLNLVRNHILVMRRDIEAICRDTGLELPEIATMPVPPPVPMDFMARERNCLCSDHKRRRLYSNDAPEQLRLF